MLFFSKTFFIIPLVLFFIGISSIPMADSLFRPEIYQDLILTEKEKEEKFQRCLGYIPSDASVAERTSAYDVCKHILSQHFIGSRVRSSIIDEHKSFIRTCHEMHDTIQATGEIYALKITTNPKMRMCIMLYNDPIWITEEKNRLELLHKWYNENLETGKEVLGERDRKIKWDLISSLKENFEEEKTIQNDIKPDSQEKEIEVVPKQEAIPEKDDRFDFKPEKQVELTIEEEKEKFCFLFGVGNKIR